MALDRDIWKMRLPFYPFSLILPTHLPVLHNESWKNKTKIGLHHADQSTIYIYMSLTSLTLSHVYIIIRLYIRIIVQTRVAAAQNTDLS